jgi:hypothetical protein
MLTQEQYYQVQDAIYKIESFAIVLFCFTQNYEDSPIDGLSFTNILLEYMRKELDKIIEIF